MIHEKFRTIYTIVFVIQFACLFIFYRINKPMLKIGVPDAVIACRSGNQRPPFQRVSLYEVFPWSSAFTGQNISISYREQSAYRDGLSTSIGFRLKKAVSAQMFLFFLCWVEAAAPISMYFYKVAIAFWGCALALIKGSQPPHIYRSINRSMFFDAPYQGGNGI